MKLNSEIEKYKKYQGTFNPRILDTVKPELINKIGIRFNLKASYKIEEGVYQDQWVFHSDSYEDLFYNWVPFEDLDNIIEIE